MGQALGQTPLCNPSPLAGEEQARREAVGRRGRGHDVGLALAIAFTVLLAWAVEWLTLGVSRGPVDGLALFVLSLFVVPLLISLAAIAKSMATWSPRARWVSALLILLVPPALLLLSGAFHG